MMNNHRIAVTIKTLMRTVVLPWIFITILACAKALPNQDDNTGSGTDTERMSSTDFDTYIDGIPAGMKIYIGATTGDTEVDNLIQQDENVFHTGSSSLRISGDETTTQWRFISVEIPEGVRFVTARLFVKGKDLQQELNQFNNCCAGFFYDDLRGETSRTIVSLQMGTSDWTEVSVSLDTEAHIAENVKFFIFSSISGTVWVDDLTFIYDEESDHIGQTVSDGPLSPYIQSLAQPTTFLEVVYAPDSQCPDSISASEALQDIEMLKYLFENGYSGYTYWNTRGVNFTSVYDDLTELASENETVSVVDMECIIAEGLTGIQDGHFGVAGHERHRFLNRKNPFFADVIVERIHAESEETGLWTEYTVVRSNCDSVLPGMIYAGSEDQLFRIMSRHGVEQFQLGVLTGEYTTEASFQFLEGSVEYPDSSSTVSITLPLHECRLNRYEQQNDRVFYRTEVDGIDLVRVSSFSVNNHEDLLGFIESGTALAGTDRFIVDLMGNGGGSSTYGEEFIRNLNGTAQRIMYRATLCSPATTGSITARPITEDMPAACEETAGRMQHALERMRERPVRSWLYVRDELAPREMGDYNGCAVFLINRRVASSGEALIDYSRSVPGAVLIGENSAGIGSFGDVLQYWLPNSLIHLYMPYKLSIVPDFEEGVGYLPDYWLDSEEPVREIARWLNNPYSYQFELSELPVHHALTGL